MGAPIARFKRERASLLRSLFMGLPAAAQQKVVPLFRFLFLFFYFLFVKHFKSEVLENLIF
jgi:hypothetical protein